jgi:hypothetical protein
MRLSEIQKHLAGRGRRRCIHSGHRFWHRSSS